MSDPPSGTNHVKKFFEDLLPKVERLQERVAEAENEIATLNKSIEMYKYDMDVFLKEWNGDGPDSDGWKDKIKQHDKTMTDQKEKNYGKKINETHAWFDAHGEELEKVLPRITRAVDLLDGQGSAAGQQPLWDTIYGSRNLQKYLGILAAAFVAAVGTYPWNLIQ